MAVFRVEAAQIDIQDYQTVVRATSAENDVFHAIAVAAHNVYMLEIFEKLRLQGQRMLRLAFAYTPRGQIQVAKFAEARVDRISQLAELVKSGDADGAEAQSQLLHADMVERLMAYLSENLTDDVGIEDAATTGAP